MSPNYCLGFQMRTNLHIQEKRVVYSAQSMGAAPPAPLSFKIAPLPTDLESSKPVLPVGRGENILSL